MCYGPRSGIEATFTIFLYFREPKKLKEQVYKQLLVQYRLPRLTTRIEKTNDQCYTYRAKATVRGYHFLGNSCKQVHEYYLFNRPLIAPRQCSVNAETRNNAVTRRLLPVVPLIIPSLSSSYIYSYATFDFSLLNLFFKVQSTSPATKALYK